MIVRNEAAHLARCLDSVRGLVAEIIVVDTGSTDATIEVARAGGALVIETNWEHDFSRARNLSLRAAAQPWILVLDADEWLLPDDRAAIAALVSGPQPLRGYSLLQTSASGSGPGEILVAIVRLFPNRTDIRYDWPIHEQVVTALDRAGIARVETAIRIQHSGYSDPAVNLAKQRRNLAILERQEGAGSHPLNTFLLAGAYLDVGRPADALEAYRRMIARADAAADLVAGANLRVATCLLRLGRPEEALAALPFSPAVGSHPEIFSHLAAAQKALGHPEIAAAWNERLFDCRPGATIPPSNLTSLKAAAVNELALGWRAAGKPELALALLRHGRNVLGSGADFSHERLAQLYAEFGAGRAPA